MKPIGVKIKSKYAAFLLLVILLISLTLSLRGTAPITFIQKEIPASAVQTMMVSYDFEKGANWGINDFSTDLSNWRFYCDVTGSILSTNEKILCLSTPIGTLPGHHYVVLTRDLNISTSELPIFSINVSVSKGADYHVRFAGINSAGAFQEVWWETSPLDDINGKSTWELNAVDLATFSKQATGEIIPTITIVQVILDKLSSQAVGDLSLQISSIRFSELNLKQEELSPGATFSSGSTPFQSIIINVPPENMPSESWRLLWTSVTYTLTSNEASGYRMLFLSKNNGALIDGATFMSHEASFTDIYKLEGQSFRCSHYQSLTFIMPLISSDYSIIIFRESWKGTSFSTFKLDSIEITSCKILSGGG